MWKWETGNESGAARPGATGVTEKGVRQREGGEIREERWPERMSRCKDVLSGATHGGREEVGGWEVSEIRNDEKGASCPGRQGMRRRGCQAGRETERWRSLRGEAV